MHRHEWRNALWRNLVNETTHHLLQWAPGETHRHHHRSKEKHPHEVRSAPTKRILFQQTRIAAKEVHVKHEIDAERSKEKEVGKQSPHLIGTNTRR